MEGDEIVDDQDEKQDCQSGNGTGGGGEAIRLHGKRPSAASTRPMVAIRIRRL